MRYDIHPTLSKVSQHFDTLCKKMPRSIKPSMTWCADKSAHWLVISKFPYTNQCSGMPPMIKGHQYQQGYTFIRYRQVISGRPRKWYCWNKFTLFTTLSPTFVGFFVCGRVGRFKDEIPIFIKLNYIFLFIGRGYLSDLSRYYDKYFWGNLYYGKQ